MEQQATHRRAKNGASQDPDPGLSAYVFGKVQPQALPLEEAVLGALMIDRDALNFVVDILTPESFYLEAHQHIFEAIVALFTASQPIDLLTVPEELKRRGLLEKVGGSYYLVELSSRVASSANIEHHARIIAQKALQRSLIRLASQLTKTAYEDTTDAFDLLATAERELFAIGAKLQRGRGPQSLAALALSAYKSAELAAATPDGLVGVPSGFTSIDRITGGWRPGDLIIIAGRPGMGKSSLAADFALNAARDFGRPSLIFSLEMSGEQIAGRILSTQAKVNGSRLRNGQASEGDFSKLGTALDELRTAEIHIDETAGISAFEMLATARRMVRKNGIQMVVVDYLQLIGKEQGDKSGANRDQFIGEVTRGLKRMGKELQIPVICLCQLSRAVETRGGAKRPLLSDLRESGNVEQDADIVAFVYRPEYYGITEDESGQSTQGVAEFIIAKHRNGKLCTVKLEFIDELTHFQDAETSAMFPGPSAPASFHQPMPRHEPKADIPF